MTERYQRSASILAKALAKAPISPSPHERSFADVLIAKVFARAGATTSDVGISLAAAFDLFVSAEYYSKITNRGWLYCPSGEPLLLYPFTNTCPRCILTGTFHFHKSNKPTSGSIGETTSRLLCIFLERLFQRFNRKLRVYKGIEPVDVIIQDAESNTLLLAEVKAAPLVTLPLAVQIERQTEMSVDEITAILYTRYENAFLNNSELQLLLPLSSDQEQTYRLAVVGTRGDHAPRVWCYQQLTRLFSQDDMLFDQYCAFWLRAFRAYDRAERQQQTQIDKVYWLTNGCGQPAPRPADWPARAGSGFESVSDGKSSVGMDRTDDIKKGIYQVLKIGATAKPGSTQQLKAALISNIHAVRHYDEYLSNLQDVVWASYPVASDASVPTSAGDLPDQTPLYNLFDGIISFTKTYSRDTWISENFTFEADDARL